MVQPKSFVKRRAIAAFAAATVLAGVLAVCAYLHTSQFQSWLRGRVVGALEQVTGGRVELRSLSWNLWRLEIDANDVTVHGLEAAGEEPYLHTDRLSLRLQLLSWITGRTRIGLRYLELDRPVAHLILYPDGSTNQPHPQHRRNIGEQMEQLVDLRIERVELRNGALLLNSRRLPFDLRAKDLAFALSWLPGKGGTKAVCGWAIWFFRMAARVRSPLRGKCALGCGATTPVWKRPKFTPIGSTYGPAAKYATFTTP